ncbi:MAG: cytochrome c biogenesis protein [Bacteroidia bacterium]
MKHWWKFLCAVLLVYSIVAGLFVPLGPGIADLSPVNVAAGTTATITIYGYNTHFNKEAPQFWLKNDTIGICATETNVIDRKTAKATFYIPEAVPQRTFTLLGASNHDGLFLLDNALMLRGDFKRGAPQNNCPIIVKNKSASFFSFPNREILNETIRNLYFHVPMWWSMMLMFLLSIIFSIGHLRGFHLKHDYLAAEAAKTGMLFGIFGLITGMIWARFTWGDWWIADPRLNGSAATLLAYSAYFILRNSMTEEQKRARVAAVYNIFAFVMMLVLIMIYPRMADSLHPGSGGNPAFSSYDLDQNMRLVFYPAVLGWFLLAVWIFQLRWRILKIKKITEGDLI